MVRLLRLVSGRTPVRLLHRLAIVFANCRLLALTALPALLWASDPRFSAMARDGGDTAHPALARGAYSVFSARLARTAMLGGTDGHDVASLC